MALTIDGEQKKTYKGKNFDKSKATSHCCGEKGHYGPECGQKGQSAENLLMSRVTNGEFYDSNHVAFHFQQQHSLEMSESSRIPSSWILLDNQSTVGVFHNEDLLDNIRDRDSFMAIHCNAGITSTNLVVDLPGCGEVWYNPN
jgi:hypothetical protein